MPLRKIIAYILIALIVVSLTLWVTLKRRRELAEKQRRHGPRPD